MDSVLGYARTFLLVEVTPSAFVARVLRKLWRTSMKFWRTWPVILSLEMSLRGITAERMLHGPLSDVMTHVGQLAIC